MNASLYQDALHEVMGRVANLSGIVPEHRKAFREGYSFSKVSYEEQLGVWDYVWKQSGNFWARIHALFFLEKMVVKEVHHEILWDVTQHWQEEVDNWGHCDGLAKIYTKLLVTQSTEVYAKLSAWNKDENLWKRRQSVVSLLYFSSTKRVYPSAEQIEALIVPLLSDKEYYVQKGVGWALRELHTVYHERGLEFVAAHVNSISAIAFAIAMEKLSKEEKEWVKGLRGRRRIAL